jgi:hypothetical protein
MVILLLAGSLQLSARANTAAKYSGWMTTTRSATYARPAMQ